jgi:hypothetical protein
MELLSADEEGDDLAGGLDSADTHSVFNLSIQEAYSSLDSALVDAAISTELENMMKYKVWEALDATQVDATVLQQVIPSKLFLKEKFDASGNFLKLKARLVAGGHTQNSDSYSEVASPTTDITSVFVALNICTYFENCQFYTGDIPAAYLNSKLSEVVYMTLPVSVTSILLRVQPSLQSCVNQGRITVKLLKSIYGLKQAALDWHIEINSTLTGLCGLTRSTIDPCLFFNAERCILLVNVHVDDLLIVSNSQSAVEAMHSVLKDKYGNFDLKCDKSSYLGMEIEHLNDNSIAVKQTGFLQSILNKCDYKTTHVTPSTVDFFRISRRSVRRILEQLKHVQISLNVSHVFSDTDKTRHLERSDLSVFVRPESGPNRDEQTPESGRILQPKS